jgi:hypothetical protein
MTLTHQSDRLASKVSRELPHWPLCARGDLKVHSQGPTMDPEDGLPPLVRFWQMSYPMSLTSANLLPPEHMNMYHLLTSKSTSKWAAWDRTPSMTFHNYGPYALDHFNVRLLPGHASDCPASRFRLPRWRSLGPFSSAGMLSWVLPGLATYQLIAQERLGGQGWEIP